MIGTFIIDVSTSEGYMPIPEGAYIPGINPRRSSPHLWISPVINIFIRKLGLGYLTSACQMLKDVFTEILGIMSIYTLSV